MSSIAQSGGKIATQWRCNHCKKYLSSKRSYREHMNVHSERRPFQCDECEYAAASQMTLRRHRLRLHIPRSEWGYPCPYPPCPEVYMEPASYEQHVSRRHFGRSCTYGCPHQSCNFTSKSSRHFMEHISRHHMVIISSQSNIPPFPDNFAPDSIKASYYLIDDEIGSGYGKPPLEAEIRRYDDVLSLTTKTRAKPNPKAKSNATVPTAKIVSPMPSQSRAKRKPITKETTNNSSTEVSFEESSNNDVITEVEEIIYEEVPEIQEIEEEEEEAQYYEIVDENGISIDNQYYEIDPTETEEYETEFIEENSTVVVDCEMNVTATSGQKIDKHEKRLLPDGQVDIDLD